MDKGLLVKGLVVALALLFMLEPVAMSIGRGGNGGQGETGEVYSGAANVNITIYSYGAFLYAQAPTQFQITQISGHPGVLGMEDAGNGVYRITLRDSAKTREIYSEFDEMGINTMAIAQVGLPEEYELHLDDGSVLSVKGGYEQLVMAPIMEEGSVVSYVLSVESDGENTLGITAAQSYTYEVGLEVGATVGKSDTSSYAFMVPWEERNLDLESLEAEYGEENVEYVRRDYMAFEPALSMEETLMLKKDYMTYISASSASVEANFTNSSMVREEFGGRALLPDSLLMLSAEELPDLGYNHTAIKKYAISLPVDFEGYSIGIPEINITSEDEFSEGDSVVLTASATATGNSILALRNISVRAS